MKLLIVLNLLFLSELVLSADFSDYAYSEFRDSNSDFDSETGSDFGSETGSETGSDFGSESSSNADSICDDKSVQSAIPEEYQGLSLSELEEIHNINGKNARLSYEMKNYTESRDFLEKAKEFRRYIDKYCAEEERKHQDSANERTEYKQKSDEDDRAQGLLGRYSSDRQYRHRKFPSIVRDHSAIPEKTSKSNLESSQVLFTTDAIDGKTLSIKYLPPIHKNRGVVVLFKDDKNAGIDWENSEVFRFFRKIGLGILIPHSRCRYISGSFNRSLLFDTEAIVNFLINDCKINRNKIFAFGYSLGSAYATNIASYFRTPLMLQNGCEKSEDIIKHWGQHTSAEQLGKGTSVKPWRKHTATAILNKSKLEDYVSYYDETNFRHYEGNILRMYDEFGYSFLDLKQDFGNNVGKLSKEKDAKNPIDVMIIYTGRNDNYDWYENAFGLFESRYGENYAPADRIFIDEDCDPSQFPNNSLAKLMILNFLTSNKLIPRIEVK